MADSIYTKFGAVEAALAEAHHIASDKRTQFQARLRKFQRMGIPTRTPGLPPTKFTPFQIVELALAMQLTELGMAPERVVAVHKYVRGVAALAAGRAARESMNIINRVADRLGRKIPNLPASVPHTMLLIDPNNLENLTRAEGEQSQPAPYPGVYTTDRDPNILLEWLRSSPRYGVVNMTRLTWTVYKSFMPEPPGNFFSLLFIDTARITIDEKRRETRRTFDRFGDRSVRLLKESSDDDGLLWPAGVKESMIASALGQTFDWEFGEPDVSVDGTLVDIPMPFAQRVAFKIVEEDVSVEVVAAAAAALKEQAAKHPDAEVFTAVVVKASISFEIRSEDVINAAAEHGAAVLSVHFANRLFDYVARAVADYSNFKSVFTYEGLGDGDLQGVAPAEAQNSAPTG